MSLVPHAATAPFCANNNFSEIYNIRRVRGQVQRIEACLAQHGITNVSRTDLQSAERALTDKVETLLVDGITKMSPREIIANAGRIAYLNRVKN